mgnify:CR=1 FL=1
MKKALAMVLALVMCLGLVACAGSDSGSPPATTKASTDTKTPAAESSGRAAEGKNKVYYTAYIGDFGLADMGWRATQAAQEKYGYDVTLVEYGNDSSQAVNSLIDALDTKHYDYVMAMGWDSSPTPSSRSPRAASGPIPPSSCTIPPLPPTSAAPTTSTVFPLLRTKAPSWLAFTPL